MKLTVFAKFQAGLSLDALAAWVRDVGLDAVNLVVRDGFWCQDATLHDDVPRFMQAMRRRDIDVPLATAAVYDAQQIIEQPDRIRILADHGIPAFRMGYFARTDDPRSALETARRQLAQVAALCERIGIKAIYQLHHGQLIASPSAAYMVVRELPPEAVGVMLDPGNQSHEGWENLAYSVALLGPHLAAVGVKDSRWVDGKPQWCPLGEGELDWPAIASGLTEAGFDGTLVLMPFYHAHEPEKLKAALAREVAAARELFGLSLAPAD